MSQYRIIIAGGRHFSDYVTFQLFVQGCFEKYGIQKDQAEIISGHCQGVDQMGERYAKENGIPCSIFPAQWSKYGRSAGFRRNVGMVNYASEAEHPLVIAFWNGQSHGTGFTIQKAREKGIQVEEYLYQSPEAGVKTSDAQVEDKLCKRDEANKTISASPEESLPHICRKEEEK